MTKHLNCLKHQKLAGVLFFLRTSKLEKIGKMTKIRFLVLLKASEINEEKTNTDIISKPVGYCERS